MKYPNTGNLATDYHIVCEWLKEKEAEIDRLKAERKEFCPNCEAETPCTHEAELFVCDICGEDFAKYIVSRNCNVSDVSVTQDVLTDVKTPLSIEMQQAEAEIDRLKAERRWIPVWEKLPENKQHVLYWAKGDGLYLGAISDEGLLIGSRWITRNDSEVTHWMPLPAQPPSEEEC